MYKAFQEEQFNRKTVEIKEGFITYNTYEDGSLYIHILYIKPEYRSQGVARVMENILIEKHKPTVIYCFVDTESNKPELSLQAILGVGYKIDHLENNRIVLRKDV